MRICHVITRLIVGGAQENTLLTCEGLQARGHEVLLLAGLDAGPEGSLWDRARAGGYAVASIPSMHRSIRPLADLGSVLQLQKAFLDFDPDVIHTHSSKAGIVGRWAASATPAARVVHTIHGMSFNATQPWPIRQAYRFCEQLAAERTDRFVSVADAMTRHAVAGQVASPHKFTTVYSGMDTTWFEPNEAIRSQERQALGLNEHDIVVGTVARLFRNKGYEQLIPAMATAASTDRRLRFVWVGDGPHRSAYANQLSTLGLRDRVYFTGLLEPRRVGDVMQAFDILVHASQWEGLPRAVVQGLLLGKAVISFDNDGAPEVVIDHDTGRLIEMNNTAALGQAMLELAGDRDMCSAMGARGRLLCLPRFNHERMVDALEQLYETL